MTVVSLLIPAAAGPLSSADEAILASGEVLVGVIPDAGGAAGQVDAVIDIPAPAERVWAVMLDCNRAPHFLEGLKSCRVLEEGVGKRWDIREHKVQWSWAFPTVRSVFRSEYEPMREIRFKRVEGDLKELEGSWRLEPLNQRSATRVFYHARVDPGILLPNSVVRLVLEHDIPQTLKALRAEIEKSGRSQTH